MAFEQISRRSFVTLAGAGALMAVRGVRAEKLQSLCAQLYTVRELLPGAPDETLRRIAEIGYREVEIVSTDLENLAPILKKYGLKPVGGHYDAALVLNMGGGTGAAGSKSDAWKSAVDLALKHGVKYLTISYLRPEQRGGLDVFRAFSDKMNRAGEICRASGLRLAYHNHAFEFEPMEGTRPIEVLLDRFEAGMVDLELDVFWASVAGLDPVQFIRKYPGRVPLLHLKDKAEGTPQAYVEKVQPDQFKEVGSGVLDFKGILRAAVETDVKHFIVEQDRCPGNPLDSLAKSFSYLNKLDF